MSTPAFILGAAMLFRGWLIGPVVLAAVVGLVLEAPRFISWRLEITRRQFGLVWNVCVVLFICIAAFFIATEPSKAVAALLRWAPIAMLPMMTAIVYSTSGKVDLDILSVLARNRVRREGEAGRTGVTLAYPFLLLCILSASTAYDRTPWFYAGSVVFLAWALWGVRSRSAALFPWLALIVLSGGLGYAGHVGLHALQGKVEQVFTSWYAQDRSDEGDVNTKHSALGGIGSRKLSNRIKIRVELPAKAAAPVLLREAAYTTFRAEAWHAGIIHETPVMPGGAGTWQLGAEQRAGRAMTIHTSLGEGAKVLPLPLGAARIEGLPAAALSRSQLGTVTVNEGPGMADYRVIIDPGSNLLDKPTEKDISIPDRESPLLRKMALKLGLSPADPVKAMAALAGHFDGHFQYARPQAGDQGAMPLAKFLQSERAGNCEYFATATVLLMRAAGIPARYAVGYSVQEYSDLEKMFIVRSLHAHAWCLVYVAGAWRDFDTTPQSWAAMENTRSPVTSYVYDLWQRVAFLFSQWRRGFSAAWLGTAGIWGLIALVLFLAWHMHTRRWIRGKGQNDFLAPRPCPGGDSEFYAVEEALQAQGFLRQPWEAIHTWLERLRQQHMLSEEQHDRLKDLFLLHDRYRFDPQGITPEERERLRASARRWLEAEQLNERAAGSRPADDDPGLHGGQ